MHASDINLCVLLIKTMVIGVCLFFSCFLFLGLVLFVCLFVCSLFFGPGSSTYLQILSHSQHLTPDLKFKQCNSHSPCGTSIILSFLFVSL